jgi:hypothetical protein
MAARHLQPGAKVRYTMDNLGLVGREELVGKGDLGYMIGPTEDDGWYYTEPEKHPHTLCPVNRTMIEAA